jgi:hypothetical protein
MTRVVRNVPFFVEPRVCEVSDVLNPGLSEVDIEVGRSGTLPLDSLDVALSRAGEME